MNSQITVANPRQAMTDLQARLEQSKESIAQLLPAAVAKYMNADKVIKIVLGAASRNPKLLACTPVSILKAIMEVAPMGLEICGPSGHVYLSSFRNKHTGDYEAVPIPGYKGYIDLAFRTEKFKDILCEPVYGGDHFKLIRRGDAGDDFEHEAKYKSTNVILCYCRARFVNGGCHIQIMTAEEIGAIRKRSKAGDFGPWVTDPIEMSKKTVVRRAQKYWPKSWELDALADLDSKTDTGAYMGQDAADATAESVIAPVRKTTEALAAKLEAKTRPAAKKEAVKEQPKEPPVDESDGVIDNGQERVRDRSGEDEPF